MPRISEETIERIKREVSVSDLARRRGIALHGHGENLIGLCPFLEDHEPSLVITPAKNLWNCLGACQKGGDVIRWVEVAERVPFRRAVEILARESQSGSSSSCTRSLIPERSCRGSMRKR